MRVGGRDPTRVYHTLLEQNEVRQHPDSTKRQVEITSVNVNLTRPATGVAPTPYTTTSTVPEVVPGTLSPFPTLKRFWWGTLSDVDPSRDRDSTGGDWGSS